MTVGKFLFDTVIDPMIKGINTFIIAPLAGGVERMSGILNSVGAAFQGFMNAILKFPEWFQRNLVEPFLSGLGKIGEWIWNALPGWVKDALNAITNFFTKDLVNFFTKTLPSFFDTLSKGFQDFIRDPLGWFQRNLVDPLVKGLNAIGQWIWNALPDWFKDALTAIQRFFTQDLVNFFTKTLPDFLTNLWAGIQDFLKDPLGWINRNVITPLANALNAIGQWIWNALPDWMKNAITAIQNFFTKTVPEFFTSVAKGIQEFFKDPLGWLKTHLVDPMIQGFNALGQWIWNALPDWLKEGLEAIGNVFKGIAEGVVNFFKDPLGTIKKGLEALWGGIQWLGQKIWEGLQWLGGIIFKGLTAAGEWLWNAIKGGVEWFVKTLTDFGTTIVNTITGAVVGGLKAIGESLIKMTVDFVEWLLGASQKSATHVGPAITNLAVALVKPFEVIVPTQLGAPLAVLVDEVKLAKNVLQSISSFGKLIVLWGGTIAISQALATGAWAILHGIATPLDKVRIVTPFKIKTKAKGKVKGHPVGVGGEGGAEGGVEAGISVPITINLGLFIRHIAREVRKYADTIGRALAYGFGIWVTQPMVRLANSIFRNMLVVELPTLEMITESLRRHMPHEKFKDLLEKAREYLALYGYSDTVIQWLTSTVDEEGMAVTITDRFGRPRKIPVSLMYNLPSPSDVARMVIRDVITSVDDLKKLFMMRGMSEDIGILYYLLHFRYPPPERLWIFYTRGISGLLWARISGTEARDVERDVKASGGFPPKSPEELNFEASTLENLLKTYLKWHDFARFAYAEGWPSDNLIVMDTLADIPTKIDQRWLVRFGLYQLLSERGVGYKSAVSEFCEKVVESTPKGKVILDLTNFCRTLQATGLHPYWVPITAVAETINTITDERTLLRTGIINLYKEGFLDSSAVLRLGQGIVMTSFNVAYFDPVSNTWKTGYINVPLRYLGMEAQLIGLRAIMDRALDILRDIQRDALTAYQEFIITDESEFKSKLSNIINSINSIYEQEYTKIIGESPPEDLKLKYVESYYSTYLKSLEIWREVFTTRRIRMWTQRWLGWVMYRAAYGTVTKEDIQKLISLMKDYAKLTEKEVQFIQGVLDIMYGMARREVAAEYLPTPSTMATLSEYLTLDTGLVKKILTERGIPEEWQNIWLRYISVKPIKSDAKSLLSAHVRAFRYGAITREALDAFISTLPQYGFTDREIDIIRRIAELEELILEARENRREYIPTPSMLATLSEYVALDPSLIQKVFDARNVPAEWRVIWSQYISVRPIADDVKALLSTYRRVSLYVKIPDEIAKQVLEYAKLIGFTEKELAILDLRNRLEEMLIEYRENRREYIPTPSMLATMSEYMTIPADLIQKVFEARRVPPEWQTIWKQYINIRPIVDDVRGLLSSYRRALIYVVIPDDIKKKVESYANMIGFTQTEWDILALRVTLEELILEARESRREYIPTPMTLATLCEYLPEAREFFDDVVKARRIPTEWQKLWAKYIDLRPLIDDIKRYLSRAEQLYVRFMIKKDDFMKVLNEVAKNIGYTTTEIDFLLKVTEFERYANAWRELIGTVDRLVELSEYSPKATKYALGKVYEMIDALPLPQADKQELKAMWEEYIKNRPVKSEARLYITQLSNAYAEGLISDADFSRELESMKQWGFSDNEIMFYKARAALMKARKLKLPLMWE
jgi:hypothetical protein